VSFTEDGEMPAARPQIGKRRSAGSCLSGLARERPELIALFGLLALGLAARIYFTLVWSPAITGYSDSGIYFQDAVQGVWVDPIRTVGYGMFLVVLHALSPHLLLVTLVQHAMGLADAALLFLTVRRVGGPRWLGLLPAAIVALGGDELFIEHAALSETVYVFLLGLMLYCAVRAAENGRRAVAWAGGAGLCAGLGVWDRGAAISVLPVAPLFLLLCRRRPTRRTLALAALTATFAFGSVGAYIEWRHLASGLSGLTTNGNWNLYGRVAPWADCTKFTPPPGTEQLCESPPPAQRVIHSADWYIYDGGPALALLGPAYRVSTYPNAMSKLWSFSTAAIEAQPLDYLNAVWQDTLRFVDPNHPSYGDVSANQLIAWLLYGPDMHSGQNEFVSYWQNLEYPHDAQPHHGDIAPLKFWEKLTRFDGPWMVILLLLCVAAPWVVPGEARRGARLLAATTIVLLAFPILSKGYDYRFVIPAFGPLFATAALAAWGISVRISGRRRGTDRPT
jgi:hypothetical protein